MKVGDSITIPQTQGITSAVVSAIEIPSPIANYRVSVYAIPDADLDSDNVIVFLNISQWILGSQVTL